MLRFSAFAFLVVVALCGCPANMTPDNQSPVTVIIGASSTHGSAPLRVSFSGSSSSSTAGDIVSYQWNIAGLAAPTTSETTFDFDTPGRYTVSLTVTDDAGNEAITSVDIRVQGEAPTAVIQSDRTTGNVPLTVRFDGTASHAADDSIIDYYWDFGDVSESREPKPIHVYRSEGTYTVTLRVVTGGGAEATTTAEISVGTLSASLQFDGGQFATLPLGGSQTLSTLTFEAWVKAGEGGTVASIGDGALALSVSPAENRIRVQIRGTSTDISATNLSGSWRHIAVSYDAAATAVIYLDGVALGSAVTNGDIGLDRVLIGQGFRGNLSEVRLWSVARSASDVAATRNQRVSGTQDGLIGAWPLNEGSGQALANAVGSGATDGSLGASIANEGTDPAWSSNAPTFP